MDTEDNNERIKKLKLDRTINLATGGKCDLPLDYSDVARSLMTEPEDVECLIRLLMNGRENLAHAFVFKHAGRVVELFSDED